MERESGLEKYSNRPRYTGTAIESLVPGLLTTGTHVQPELHHIEPTGTAIVYIITTGAPSPGFPVDTRWELAHVGSRAGELSGGKSSWPMRGITAGDFSASMVEALELRLREHISSEINLRFAELKDLAKSIRVNYVIEEVPAKEVVFAEAEAHWILDYRELPPPRLY